MVGYDPWHWDEEEKMAGKTTKPCRDPYGHHDNCPDRGSECTACMKMGQFCHCENCSDRRELVRLKRKANHAKEMAKLGYSNSQEPDFNAVGISGRSFLLPTIGQRAWSLVKALLFGGSCVAAVEVVKELAR